MTKQIKNIQISRRKSDNSQRPNESFDDSAEFNFDRAQAMKIAANDDSRSIEREIEKLNASTDEEIDALRINMMQDDEVDASRDGTGLVTDDVAEETLERFTEVGPFADDRGAESVAPGRDDTSPILDRHHRNTGIHDDDLAEGSLDEPSDEAVIGDELADEALAERERDEDAAA